jgi:hypothetical protein
MKSRRSRRRKAVSECCVRKKVCNWHPPSNKANNENKTKKKPGKTVERKPKVFATLMWWKTEQRYKKIFIFLQSIDRICYCSKPVWKQQHSWPQHLHARTLLLRYNLSLIKKISGFRKFSNKIYISWRALFDMSISCCNLLCLKWSY